ncbi:MAG TPA: glycosyltransferase family 1 protein [Gammaproteobacteria bacterium]|nr:glycosyltransferase family 1 protein [Gammaproteobacteria bacterium]
MKPIRILHVRNSRGIAHVTGPESHLLSLLGNLDTESYQSLLVCITDPRQGETPWLRELRKSGLQSVLVPVKHMLSLRDFTSILLWIRRFRAQIVHTHDHRADIAGIAAARMAGIPGIATIHGWTNWEDTSRKRQVYKWLDLHALRKADAIIANSAAEVSQLPAGNHALPTVIVPHGVDLQKFDAERVGSSPVHRLAPEDKRVTIAVVARIHPVKGQMEFVRAAARLRQMRRNVRFVLVGDAPPYFEAYKRDVLRFISENHLEDSVVNIAVENSEVPSVLKNVDILVAPSHEEPFGLSILEAMAMGIPVVASRVGGIPEVVADGVTGILFQPGDWRALVDILCSLMDDPERRLELGRNARMRVEDRFSIQAMVSRTVKVYQDVLTGSLPAPELKE